MTHYRSPWSSCRSKCIPNNHIDASRAIPSCRNDWPTRSNISDIPAKIDGKCLPNVYMKRITDMNCISRVDLKSKTTCQGMRQRKCTQLVDTMLWNKWKEKKKKKNREIQSSMFFIDGGKTIDRLYYPKLSFFCTYLGRNERKGKAIL